TELLFYFRERRLSVKDCSALTSGLVLALFLPNHLNPLFAFFGGVFSMAVIKHSFGGLGSNWVNPAAGAWLFIRSAWPAAFNHGLEGGHLQQLTAAVENGFRDGLGSPMNILKINGWFSTPLDSRLANVLGQTVSSITGTSLSSQGYLSLFSSGGPGIIADRGMLFLLLGTVLIAASQCFRFWVPAAFIGIYALFIWIFGALPFGGPLKEGDIIFALLSGGTLAAAFILVTDPATGPKTAPGYVVFAFLFAFFTFLFRYPGLDPYGAVTAVFLVNSLVPLIRWVENKSYYEKRRQP
ncbi:MAG: RnfABCDGE type electron transport complex subunit D, partial [Treponema sp.]|nr:RnfABCDGE type electron transport complex subunit D [Treponema sp.]